VEKELERKLVEEKGVVKLLFIFFEEIKMEEKEIIKIIDEWVKEITAEDSVLHETNCTHVREEFVEEYFKKDVEKLKKKFTQTKCRRSIEVA